MHTKENSTQIAQSAGSLSRDRAAGKMDLKPPLAIVYDMTRVCPMNCRICCMGAVSAKKDAGDELTPEEKLALINQSGELRKDRDVNMDFSGGEIFTDMNNVNVLEHAASIHGKEKIGVSTSGFRIDSALAHRLAGCVNEVEMTMDAPPGVRYKLRPKAYAETAAKAIPHLREAGIQVGIQTVLAQSNSDCATLRKLYAELCARGVNVWSLLAFYPSGRGAEYPEERLTPEKQQAIVNFLKELHFDNPSACKPTLDFHYTMPGSGKSQECRCVRKSIGILPNGEVTACFWAVDHGTSISDPKFRLGNIREHSLAEIFKNQQAMYWASCAHTCELEAV